MDITPRQVREAFEKEAAPAPGAAPATPMFQTPELADFSKRYAESGDGFITGAGRYDIGNTTSAFNQAAGNDPARRKAAMEWNTLIGNRDTAGVADWLTRNAQQRYFRNMSRGYKRPDPNIAAQDLGDPENYRKLGNANAARRLWTPEAEAMARAGGGDSWRRFQTMRQRGSDPFMRVSRRVQDSLRRDLRDIPNLPEGYQPKVLANALSEQAQIISDVKSGKKSLQDGQARYSELKDIIDKEKKARADYSFDYSKASDARETHCPASRISARPSSAILRL